MELGEALHRLARTVLEREVPVLRAHGVAMWDHAVLSGLADGPSPTQAQLAAAVGRDKTRLIPILDGLEARGLLRRTPDPDDRRNRIVELTRQGRELLGACRAAIRALEDELLDDLDPAAGAEFRATLQRLVDAHDRPPRP